MRILEFKEFKKLLLEDDLTDAAAASGAASGVGDTASTSDTVVPPPPPPPPSPDMGAGLPPDPNAQPVTPASTTSLKFIFIQDAKNKKWHGQHSENGGVKRFTQYEIGPEALTRWLEDHNMESNKDLVMAALAGKRPMPNSVYSTFHKEVTSGIVKDCTDKGTVDVTFKSDDNVKNPTSDNLEVNFVRIEPSN